MEAKCPECFGEKEVCGKCNGSGRIEVGFSRGDLYSLDCRDCGEHIGGCVVGEEGLKEVPPPKPCVFCRVGTAVYTKEGKIE